ncbi:MAG: DNA mismatch repair protein MutL [Pseudoalteromonas tetraodonis]|jgi:DNA mismatch repair protein MutL
MPRIQLMPDALASQVAAGEVVERPASVVKELLENSIDAGAKKIEVFVQRGGLSLIRILDDGHGMSHDDALLCLERHATSKLHTKEDLGRITTLGFRGEALPSIASVSRFRLTTREADAISGTEINVDGGKLGDIHESGEAPGTQIEVRSLFYNVPARRKFLRAESTEFSHIEQQVRVHAIAFPQIAFTLRHGDRLVFQLPSTKNLRERIAGIAGMELAQKLIEIPEQQRSGIKISGYIGPPGTGRSNRQYQLSFLNHRPVESPAISFALRDSYHGTLSRGVSPVCFIFIELDPQAVDVNVHPAKKEVRFHNARQVQQALVDVLVAALRGDFDQKVEAPSASPNDQQIPQPPAQRKEIRHQTHSTPEFPKYPPSQPLTTPESPTPGDQPANAPPAEPIPFRIIGTLGDTYILMESEEGMVMLDQKAAHERILFERARANTSAPESQRLLVPITVELSPKEFDFIRQNLTGLELMGFGVEVFGSNTLKLDALPTFYKMDADPQAIIDQVFAELSKARPEGSSRSRLNEDALMATICRQAVAAGKPLHQLEQKQLIKDLLACEMPYCDPQGRPTLIQTSFQELKKKFGRG